MTRGLSPIIGLLAAMLPALAHAQTNLDQGKSASQIFTAVCAECHKAPRALAHGRDNAALTDYLREHYTTSRDQAAALAAYVLGGRGGEPIGGTQKKPPADRASAEEPKPGKPKPGKPEEGASAKPKPQRPAEADAKPKDDSGEIPSVLNPIIRPEGTKPPSAATRNRRPEPKPPAVPADADAVGRTPAASAPPTAAAVPNPAPATQAPPPPLEAPPATAAAPADGGDNAPVPRDNIAD